MSSPSPRLDLMKLDEGLPGAIEPRYSAYCGSAAAFCLAAHGHKTGCLLMVFGLEEALLPVVWKEPHPDSATTWLNRNQAVEFGAIGIAFLLVEALTGYHVVSSSWIGTGCDYLLGTELSPGQLFPERRLRLEVSGIWAGTEADIRERIRKKRAQTSRGESEIPAIVVVVEFGDPVAGLVKA